MNTRIYKVIEGGLTSSERYFTTLDRARKFATRKGPTLVSAINEDEGLAELYVIPASEFFDECQIVIGWIDAD